MFLLVAARVHARRQNVLGAQRKGSSLNPIFDQRSDEYKLEICRGRAVQSSQQTSIVAATCFTLLQRGALGSKNTNEKIMTC